MKLAAILGLIVALVMAAWAINDFRINEEVRRDFTKQGITRLSFVNEAGESVQLDVRRMSDYNERPDAIVGAFSGAALVGSAPNAFVPEAQNCVKSYFPGRGGILLLSIRDELRSWMRHSIRRRSRPMSQKRDMSTRNRHRYGVFCWAG